MKTRTILFVVVCMLVLASSPAHTQSSSQGVWVYATQYNANTVYPYGNGFNGHIQVALPDKYVKFCIIYKSCYSNYPAGRSYTINFYDGKYNVSYLGVGEVGPWNVDDNYWDPAMNWPRPRRLFRDLSQGCSWLARMAVPIEPLGLHPSIQLGLLAETSGLRLET